MASTLGELSKQMRQLAKDIPSRANTLKQQVARTINFDLLQTTPVDTGAAVSNWIVNKNEAATEIREPFAPTKEGYMKTTKGVSEWTHRNDPEVTRQANIQPALSLANETIDSSAAGEVIHITNNVPYIQALDEGRSKQANLFVDRAIILGENVVSRATLTN